MVVVGISVVAVVLFCVDVVIFVLIVIPSSTEDSKKQPVIIKLITSKIKKKL